MSIKMSLSYMLHESAPLVPEGCIQGGDNRTYPPVARCFLQAYPDVPGEECRLVFTYRPSPSPDTELSKTDFPSWGIPLVKDDEGHTFTWFEASIAVLPGAYLHIECQNPQITQPLPMVAIVELRDERITMIEAQNVELHLEYLGVATDLDELPFVSYQDLGYAQEQAQWLLQAGAWLAHEGEPNDFIHLVRYVPDAQKYEFRIVYGAETHHLLTYASLHDDLSDIEWDRALRLERFDLSVPDPTFTPVFL